MRLDTVSKNQFRVQGVANRLWNEDLAPIAREDQGQEAFAFFSITTAMGVCVPAWLLASGLMVAGMSGAQALATILLGNVIVLAVVALCGRAGAVYGIPAAVFLRASFGVVGAQVPVVLRALVSCVWFGIECWVGALALMAMLKRMMPEVSGGAVWACFAAFWLVNVLLAVRGTRQVRMVQGVSGLLLAAAGVVLLFWGMDRGGGAVLLQDATRTHGSQAASFWKLFGPSLTAVIGFWSVVALSSSDSTRLTMPRKGQTVARQTALLVAMSFYSLIAIAVTIVAASFTADHMATWSPIDRIASIQQPVVAMGCLAAVVFGTLGANLTMHVAGPASAFAGLLPQRISFPMGVLGTGLLGVIAMPWRLMADPARYIDGWLVGASGVLGPIAGVMLADYFLVRRRSLDVEGLYVRGGEYEYSGGFHVKAIRAMSAGLIVALAGLFVPSLHGLYEYAWFVGFGVAALIYLLLMRMPIVRAEIPPTPLLIPMQGFEGEGA